MGVGEEETLLLNFSQGEMLALIVAIYFPLILPHFQSLIFYLFFIKWAVGYSSDNPSPI